MKTWTGAIALIAAGVLLSGSALAQTTTPSGDAKDKPKQSTGTNPGSDATKSDATKSDATKSDAAKPDMKSDTMKSDSMKDATKGDMKASKSGRMAGGNREHVRAVQQALKDKGHDPGSVDGVMGPKTQAAIKEFQGKEGLKSSGQIDNETMAKLGVQAKAGASVDTGASASPSASPSLPAPSSSAPGAAPSSSAPAAPSDSAAPKSSDSAAPKSSAPSSSAPSTDSSAPKK